MAREESASRQQAANNRLKAASCFLAVSIRANRMSIPYMQTIASPEPRGDKCSSLWGDRQRDLVVRAELVVLEHMLGRQHLIMAVIKPEGRILQTVGQVTAGPDLEIAHVGAQTGLVPDLDLPRLGVRRDFAVVGRDVGAFAVGV